MYLKTIFKTQIYLLKPKKLSGNNLHSNGENYIVLKE